MNRKAPAPDASQDATSLPLFFALETHARTIRELVNSRTSLECVDHDDNMPLLLAGDYR